MNKSFIETQFPVSKISKESYKERKAVQGQTLTGIGKWWGRKPLILVRATILGLLLPATENPQKDREIFLKILSMDDDGLWQRKEKSVPAKDLYDIANTSERNKYFILQEEVPKWNASISNIEKEAIQKSLFEKMSYDQKITYCIRPEELVNLNASTWVDINSYLGTTATNLQELMEQLSILRYGNLVTVGDCFSGGGSVPFEAARIGLKAYGSDLNPVATLLSWAALNINGSTDDEVEQLRIFQKKVYDVVDSQITTWGVEHNEQGDRANSYLYCNETKCPACDWVVPMAPSWVIGEGPTRTIAVLKPNNEKKCFDIEVHQDVSSSELKEAENSGTISREGLSCPYCRTISPISSVRHDRKDSDGVKISGLRQWGKTDFYPNVNDIFQERLYCIRYEKKLNGKTSRYYTAPTNQDLLREKKVISLIADNLTEWQKNGYIPSDKIDSGYNTDQPIRERGWQYWHQLFNPRQLLIVGLLLQKSMELAKTKKEIVVGILGVNHNANWNSKLSRWDSGKSPSVKDTFSNQALNTLYNYSSRGLTLGSSVWFFSINNSTMRFPSDILISDARKVTKNSTFWITDPPYADAVNYHELSEFFLSWDKKNLKKAFPDWNIESHRNDAVKGNDSAFTHSMIDVYRNLAAHMPDDGMQVVMFTHQDPAVWAELSLILWSAGLQVTSAWNIATETESGGLKSGNYVKGTVLLVLRKNASDKSGWLDDIYPQIKEEVKNQIDSMQNLDDKDDPDFTDNDFLLAAYAASLKVLTKYKKIGDIDIEYEISRKRDKNTKNPIQDIIESAIKVAYDYLIPKGISKNIWKDLTKEEKFYIKGLDFERGGLLTSASYQELAKGLGVSDYTSLLASTKANQVRVKTPMDFTNKQVGSSDAFSSGLVRQILMAIYLSVKSEDANAGKNWFRNELPDYWNNRSRIIEILQLIDGLQTIADSEHWQASSQYAGYLKSLVENDGL